MAEQDEESTFVGTANLERLAELPDDRHRQAVERSLDLVLEAAASVRDRTISTFSRGYQPALAGIDTFLKRSSTSSTSATTSSSPPTSRRPSTRSSGRWTTSPPPGPSR